MFMPRPFRVAFAAVVSVIPVALFGVGLAQGGIGFGGVGSIVSSLLLGLIFSPIVMICFDRPGTRGLAPFINTRIGSGVTTVLSVMAIFWMPYAVVAAMPLIFFVSLIVDRFVAADTAKGV
jgi:hypothetical protein